MRRINLGLDAHVPPTRRDALVGALGGLAGLGIGGCGSSDDTGDTGGTTNTPGTIDHVVVLMMENRSFDHMLGGVCIEEGRTDVDGLTPQMTNPDEAGHPVGVAPSRVDCLADPPHGWSPSHAQWAEGRNDGFVRAYAATGAPEPAEVMGYLARAQAPISWALMDQYAVCDGWHASVMGPTWPNRLYGHAGTSDGGRGNDLPDGGGAFRFPTVWHKLEEAGVPWGYYYTDIPFLGLFEGAMTLGRHALLEDFFRDAARGTLPAVTWIDPGFTWNDDHPPHHVGLGQELLAAIVKALGASPLWERTLFVVTYDEHGGFHDHVPPPTTADDHAAQGFDRLGFRVPTLVVSPWARQSAVHATLNHASWLTYVCERFGIAPWTARIAGSTSMAVALDTERMARGEPLPPPALPDFDIDDEALPAECFYGQDVIAVDLDAHGEHVTRLARWSEARHPGSVRLDVRACAAAIARARGG